MSLLALIQTDKDLKEFTSIVVREALAGANLLPKEISQREAYRRYGEMRVKYWVQVGMVNPIKQGEGNCKVYYSVSELERTDFITKQNDLQFTKRSSSPTLSAKERARKKKASAGVRHGVNK